ncbi:hemolysin family protein [uncultured Alsobacter sp.]|uniref:hemolysin family protein n=1 Tax=uncultured Alsobacter sp. TaxID=1748258 RepID=UPI0025D2DD1A|nr:hemolysin family protein [uncultured Alsobacter sp.]
MIDLAVAGFLILLNGLFSLSELAIVSSRRVRLKAMADAGRRGAAAALALSEDPGRFLSTVQIGITLVGILAGAFSGAALGQQLSAVLAGWGLSASLSETLGFGVVIVAITYLSVVVGELVPKTIALRHAETIACLTAGPMSLLSRVGSPVVWLLDASTKLIFRLLGSRAEDSAGVTEDEIRTVVAEAQTAGAIEEHEQDMIAGVLRLGDRTVRAIMTPRTEVEWIDLDGGEADIRARLRGVHHSRLPVGHGGPDALTGVVAVRDLMEPLLSGGPLDLTRYRRDAPSIPDTLDALVALDILRRAEVPMALVHDEYGHFEGVVTPADILDAIAGAFHSDEGETEAVQREDGSWLVAGWMPVDEMADLLSLKLPDRRAYDTAAGLVISEMRRLPALGEAVEAAGWRFEVVDMDGRRIDKLLVSRMDRAA